MGEIPAILNFEVTFLKAYLDDPCFSFTPKTLYQMRHVTLVPKNYFQAAFFSSEIYLKKIYKKITLSVDIKIIKSIFLQKLNFLKQRGVLQKNEAKGYLNMHYKKGCYTC